VTEVPSAEILANADGSTYRTQQHLNGIGGQQFDHEFDAARIADLDDRRTGRHELL
jgi:hypothetical protein